MFAFKITFLFAAMTLKVQGRPLPEPALDAGSLQSNGRQAQEMNLTYQSLKVEDKCSAGQTACIDGAVAQCTSSGKWKLSVCPKEEERCFALPSLKQSGVVTVTCATEKTALRVMQSCGATIIQSVPVKSKPNEGVATYDPYSSYAQTVTHGNSYNPHTSASSSYSSYEQTATYDNTYNSYTSASSYTTDNSYASSSTYASASTHAQQTVTITVAQATVESTTTLTPEQASSVLSSILHDATTVYSSSTASSSAAECTTSSSSSSSAYASSSTAYGTSTMTSETTSTAYATYRSSSTMYDSDVTVKAEYTGMSMSSGPSGSVSATSYAASSSPSSPTGGPIINVQLTSIPASVVVVPTASSNSTAPAATTVNGAASKPTEAAVVSITLTTVKAVTTV